MPFPIDSFGDAFLAGEIIGFITDHVRTCSRCGRETFFDEDDFAGFDDYHDYLCPRCRDDHDWDDEDDDGR